MIFPYMNRPWVKKLMSVLFIMGFSIPVFSQQAGGSSANLETLLIVVLSFVLIVAILILIIGLYLITIIKTILLEDKKQKALEAGVEYVEQPSTSWWSIFMKKATDAVPVEKEESVLLDHAYDGIHELDNHLPPWWKWLFYITIIWGIIYLLAYHVFDALPLMYKEYDISMENARVAQEARIALAGGTIDENNVEFSDAPSVLASGKAIYDRECVACHAPEGQGLIGPNFTDNYWIHGGSMQDVFKTVKYGVPQKGMIAWQSKLSPTEMRDVSSYILTFVGTTPKNPPPPKPPEGVEYIPEEQPTEEPQTEQPAEI